MICPKCHKENCYFGNFCSHCGNPLREKCPECGEMEIVGRLICEKKLKAAKEKMNDYVARYMFAPFWPLTLFIILLMGSTIIRKLNYLFIPFLIAACLFILAFIISAVLEKKWKKKFLDKFPEETEILRKGGIIE